MSSPEIHWIKPTLPTVLAGTDYLPLPSTDLIFVGIDVIWLLPGPLDIPRLKIAISRTLGDFPHCAGRLKYNEQKKAWQNSLVNEAVCLTVGKNTQIHVTDEFMFEPQPDISGSMVFVTSEEAKKEALARFKVTEWTKTGETSISLSFCHVIGDAAAMYRMMKTLSAYYTGQNPPPKPTFEKFTNPAPPCPRSQISATLPRLPHLALNYTVEEFEQIYGKMLVTTDRVDMRVTKQQLDTLKKRANRSTGDVKLSAIDALTGYFATIWNRIDGTPVQEIAHVLGYRGGPSSVNFQPPPTTSQGNVLLPVMSKKIQAHRSTGFSTYAQLLRNSIDECSSPGNLANIAGLSEQLQWQASHTGRFFDHFPVAGSMGVSSTYRLPFQSVDFGYKGRTRFFTNRSIERFIQILPANPIKYVNSDGRAEWRGGEGDALVQFRVKKGLRNHVLAMFAKDMEEQARL